MKGMPQAYHKMVSDLGLDKSTVVVYSRKNRLLTLYSLSLGSDWTFENSDLADLAQQLSHGPQSTQTWPGVSACPSGDHGGDRTLL